MCLAVIFLHTNIQEGGDKRKETLAQNANANYQLSIFVLLHFNLIKLYIYVKSAIKLNRRNIN